MGNDSMFTRFVSAAADRLAADHRIPHAERAAFRLAAQLVIVAQASAIFGGERIYAPRRPQITRAERDARVLTALAGGEAAASIARRERITVRWVQAISARARARTTVP